MKHAPLIFLASFLLAAGLPSARAADSHGMATVATLHDARAVGSDAYGGSDSYDDSDADYEAVAIRHAKVGDYQLDQFLALTDLKVAPGATRYLGHPYSHVEATCKTASVYRMHGKLYGRGQHCRIDKAAR
jgi:hypothetical protein